MIRKIFQFKSKPNVNNNFQSNSNKLTNYEVYKYIKSFNNMVDQINTDISDEILETIQEIEKLNNIYEKIYRLDKNIIMSEEEFKLYREKLLKKRIKRKIDKYCIYNNKDVERLKSLIDELKCCKSRYEQYGRIFDLYILQIENIIEP